MIKKKGTSQISTIFSRIRSPESVKILIFVNQQVSLKDFSFISQCLNLVRLDLSHNNITCFPNKFSFQSMPQLRVLLLHSNNFQRFSDLELVMSTASLQYVTLFSNPLLMSNIKSRHFIINQMPNLKLFDEHVVVEEQRSSIVLPRGTITACSEETYLKFPLVDLSEVNTTKEYMIRGRLERRVYMGRWLQCNPVIRLQRWVRRVIKMGKSKARRATTERIKMEKKGREEDRREQGKEDRQPTLGKEAQIHEKSQKSIKNTEQSVIKGEVKNIKPPEVRIESLLRCNYDFWNTTVKNLGLKSFKWLIISKQSFKFLKQNRPSLFQSITSQKCNSYKFIRIDQQVSKEKILLSYLTQSCMKTVVTKPKKKVTRLRIVKFKPIQYKVKELSKLTSQEREKIYIKSNLLDKLEESYSENAIQLKGSQQSLISFLKYCLKSRAQGNFKYPIYCPSILERVASAVKIQSFWRGYKTRKQTKAILEITKDRAANRIQKWLRNLPFNHRLKFLKYIKDDLVDQPSYRLILHQKLYMFLNNLSNKQSNFLHLPLQQSQLFTTPNNTLQLINPSSPRRILPCYFPLALPPTLPTPSSPSCTPCSLFSILHLSCRRVFTTTHNHTRFVVFQYPSQLILKQRKLLLALKTYNFKYHTYFQCVSGFKQDKIDLYEKRVERVYGVAVRREEFVRKGRVFKTEGIFLGEQGRQEGEGMAAQNLGLKFINGTKIYETVCRCWWKKEVQEVKLTGREHSVTSSKHWLKKSKHESQHISKAVSFANSVQPSPRDQKASISSLARSLQKSVPSQSVLLNYLSANPSSSTISPTHALIISPSNLPPKSYGRYASSIQQSLTLANSTIENPIKSTLPRDISRSEISKAQSMSLELELLHNKRLKILQSKQEKIYLKSVRLNKKQEDLRVLRVEEEKEKESIVNQIERKKVQQEKILAMQHDRVYERMQRGDREQEKEFETHFVTKGNYAIRNELIQKLKNRQVKSPKLLPNKKVASAAEAANAIHLLKERLKQHPIKTKQSIDPYHQPTHPSPSKQTEHEQRQQSISLPLKPKRDRKQIIHSVFPEEFYPLQQSGEESDDKFSLPRIGKN